LQQTESQINQHSLLTPRMKVLLLWFIAGGLLTGCSGEATLAVSPTTAATRAAAPTETLVYTAIPIPTRQHTPSPKPTLPPSPTPTWMTLGPGEVEVPILLYHHVLPDPTSLLYSVEIQAFTDQMESLAELGYQSIRVSQLQEAIFHGAELPPKPIIITFDDGNTNNYEHAFPIMRSHGFSGTVYIVANRLGAKGYLSAPQLKEMLAAGWEIGSHSMTHADLTAIPSSQLRDEILGSRLRLETELEIPIHSFAYPYGSVNPQVAGKVSRYGYSTGMGLGKSTTHNTGSLFYLDRLEIRGTMSLEAFQSILEGKDKP
jgi:peptidoglycan/xylan/chitin deacetylase (PgdA/CDA1 family)